MAAEARVVALQANFCQVELSRPGPGEVERLLCTRRTRLGKRGQQICVGDWVSVEAIDWVERRGAIAGRGIGRACWSGRRWRIAAASLSWLPWPNPSPTPFSSPVF